MRAIHAIDHKKTMVTGATSAKRSYQLRKSATRSSPPNKIQVQGVKKSNDIDKSNENAKTHLHVEIKETRRSSTRLGSRSSIVGGAKTRTKRTISDASSKTINSKNSKMPPSIDTNDVVVNGRKVRASKPMIRDSKNGVGNSNKINGSHNNNDHDNIVQDGPVDDSIEANSVTKEIKSKTKRIRTKRRYICNFCDKEFLGGNDLRKHIRIHTDERPFECQHCGQRFRQGGCLKNHIASQHGTSETFTCYYCNKSFPIKERLRLHMRLHSGEKPYNCKICFKRFARGGQVSIHSSRFVFAFFFASSIQPI